MAAVAEWWLDRYHLTPDEVEALPLAVRDRIPGIAAIRDELKAEAERKAAGG